MPNLDPKEADPSLVELCESLLAKARSGELRSIVATGFVADGARMSAFGGDLYRDVYATSGALHWLAREYEDRVLDSLPEDHHA